MDRGSSSRKTGESNFFKGRTVARPGRNAKVHGEIPNFPVGSRWKDRIGCSEAGVHAPLRAGIHGTGERGAFSIVLSGGYEDDEDHGELITYTGQGGRDTKGSKMDQLRGKQTWEGPQNADQEWVRGNKALKMSCTTGKPVRVVRGHTLDSRYAPAEGYRYDGLYVVEEAWRAVGKSGFKTCRFTFRRLPGQLPLPGSRPISHIKKVPNIPKVKEDPSLALSTLTLGPGPSKLPKSAPVIQLSRPPIVPKPQTVDQLIKAKRSMSSEADSINAVRVEAPVKVMNPYRPPFNMVASGSKSLPSKNRPQYPPSRGTPLQMVKIDTKINQKGLKRSHSESDSDDEDDESESMNTNAAGRWATVEGKKKYDGIRFKKNKGM